MTALYYCVSEQHNFWLVVLAAAICAVGVLTAFALGREALRSNIPQVRYGWAFAGSVAAASSIWATHFIAMLAFEPGLPFRFEAVTTVASLVVALGLVSAAAFTVILAPTLTGRLAGGAVAGLAISAMHYTGMSAFKTQGVLHWDATTVLLSVSAGAVFATLSAILPLARTRAVRACGPLLLLIAVCLDHFIGMTAVTVIFDPSIAPPSEGLNQSLLATMVTGVALAILLLSIAAVWLATRDRRQLAAEETRMRDLADVSIEGLLLCENGIVVGANHSLELMLGANREDLIGVSAQTIIPTISDGRKLGNTETDALLRVADAQAIPVKIVSKEIFIGGKSRTVIAVRDQRERISAEIEMRRLAHEDTLTGLANRFSFGACLSDRFGSKRQADQRFALFMLDLDRFKIVNDTLGHGVGDLLLRRVADRLKRSIREGDLLARLGGDEFAIVAADAVNATEIAAIAEHIIEVISRPFIIETQIIEIGVSIGIAYAPLDGATAEALSRSADLAMYRAKDEGRGLYRFYEEGMNARMQERRDFENRLRRAIARDEFFVVYQPQIDAVTGAFDGAEALVRWQHPEKGVVSPLDFIPLAEEIGLIGAIGEFVLRQACAEAVKWPSHMSVSVNLSPVQLQDARLSKTVAAILAETRLPASRLELELTENALLQDDGRAIAVMHSLHALGVKVSMDDFGTGYSSLSHLRRFPFDKIKIDQSFVRQLPYDPDSVAIVQAVATLALKLGMKVTAEGIETEEQQRFSAAEGCHQLQGYLISRPIEAAAAAALFASAPIRSTAAA